MLPEALYRRPKFDWACAYDKNTLHIRLRVKKGDVLRQQRVRERGRTRAIMQA